MTRRSKYDPLNQFSQKNNTGQVIMTFSKVEEILGFTLPRSAYSYTAWWDNSSSHTQSYAWTEAGYKAKPQLEEKIVEFIIFEH